jgi:hypothetical protein
MRIIFLSLFITISTFARGQTNFRFADSTAQWNVLSIGFLMSGPNDYVYSTTVNYITGDTTINNHSYQKLSQGFETGSFIRKDTTGKVFVFDRYTNTEQTIYDFGKVPGDTFNIINSQGAPGKYCTIDSVDSVVILYPRKRMCVTYHLDGDGSDVWIDGIGSTKSHFLYPGVQYFCCDRPNYLLLCYHEQNSLLHHDPVYSSCVLDSTTVGIRDLPSNAISINVAPNPVTENFFTVDLDSHPAKETTLQLFDITSKFILQQPLAEKTTTIAITGISKGLYLYTISTGEQKLASGKLTVQ